MPLGAQSVAVDTPAGARTWSLPLPPEEAAPAAIQSIPPGFGLPPRPENPPLPFAAPPAYAVKRTTVEAPPPVAPVLAPPLAAPAVAPPPAAPVPAPPETVARETVVTPAPAAVEPDPGPSLSVLGGLPDYVQSPTSLGAEAETGPSSFDGIEVKRLQPMPMDPGVLANEGEPSGGAAGEPGTLKLRDMLRTLMSEDTVLAVVRGQEIRWGEVARSAEGLPEEYRDKLESLFPALLQRMIDLTLLSQEGRGRGLQDDPEVKRRLQVYEDQIIREVLLERYVTEAQTETALRQAYAAYIARESAHVTVQARHILVGSEVTARELIKELDAGADFAQLARTRSLGTSAMRGGELGTFELGRMVPAFAEAIATIPVGSYTHQPVETEFGWHVILLEARSGGDYPSFESVEPKLREEVSRRAIAQLLRTLRGSADIQIIGAETANDGAGPKRADLVDER